jgi:hypothetical protein
MKVTLEELEYLISQNHIPQIDTPTGLEDITDTYRKNGPGYEFKFSDSSGYKCAVNHKIKDDFGEWIDAKDLRVGQVVSGKEIVSMTEVGCQDWIDFTVDADHQSYFYNGLTHHNSGKSLVQYLLVRIYQLMDELHHKTIFICVPTIALVEQMYNDFKDYSTFEGSTWHVDKHCQKISSKYTKTVNTQIVITTWQSMCRLPADVVENAGVAIVDECFDGDTNILTDEGYKKITELNVGDTVINYCENKRIFKRDTILKIHKNIRKSKNDIMLELTTDTGTKIKVTENHKFLVDGIGWVKAKDLTDKMDIITYEK